MTPFEDSIVQGFELKIAKLERRIAMLERFHMEWLDLFSKRTPKRFRWPWRRTTDRERPVT